MELSWHRGVCPRAETSLFANYHKAEVDFGFGETAASSYSKVMPARKQKAVKSSLRESRYWKSVMIT
jgi:hypothetical protein